MPDYELRPGPVPYPRFKAWHPNTGVFLSGGFLYTYDTGSTNPRTTYSDRLLTVPNTNPIVLNSAGEASVEIYVNGPTKFTLKDSEGNTLWDVDYVCIVDNVANYLASFGYALQTSVQTSTHVYGSSGTGTDSYVVTLSPVPVALTSGLQVVLMADVTNTGAATVNVNGLGAIAIKKAVGTSVVDIVTNDVLAGVPAVMIYSATHSAFILTNPTIHEGYKVGDVHISTNSANPSTYFYYGTWAAFATGRFLVGLDAAQVEFDTVEETGGAKTKNLSHTHDMGNHTHSIDHVHGDGHDFQPIVDIKIDDAAYVGNSGTPSTNTTSSGGSATQDILPPYIVVYMWKRTA